MSRLIRFWATYAAVLTITPANAGDRFDYSVTYRGVFSMGMDMPIADAVLSVGPIEPSGPLVETRLDESLARYPTVGVLYPFRYRFRSWSRPDLASGVVAFEAYKKTRPSALT